MAHTAALIMFGSLVVIALAQYLLVRIVVRALGKDGEDGDGNEQPLPKVAVITCLRGGDPFLVESLKGIFSQDYPSYEVHVVVDRREDPAWGSVEEVIAQTGAEHVRVMQLTDRRETCSLKCSSLYQAISALDESFEVVALVDADAQPHPTWLKELVMPLARDDVGATTGNRWYMPASPSPANLVRYLWNAAAIPQMCAFGISWGGTLAVNRDVFAKSDLLEKWGNAYCEDAMVYSALRSMGLRVVFVPSLVMVNREDCTLGGFVEWLRRQLLAARLYHPSWPFTVFHALGTSAVWAAALGVALWGWAAGDVAAVAWSVAAAAAYIAIMLVYLPMLETGVRTVVRRRGEPTRWMSWRTILAIPLAGLLLQLIYPTAVVSTMLLRRVRWRGIDYSVDGPWKVRMLGYEPFVEQESERQLSL